MPDEKKSGKEPPAGSQNDGQNSETEANGAGEQASTTESRLDDINALLVELVRQREAASSQKKDFWYFLSSGVFFMLVGSLALLSAFLTMTTTHASFTFVLVVVGVAMLLYGTGTQGAGNFESTAGAMKYRVGMAGGAGILAFAVALGIVLKSSEIRDAFQVERKYARLYFRDQGDGVGNLAFYIPEITVDGAPVPAQRSGEYIVAYVPYFANPGDRQIQVSASFYYVGSGQTRNRLLSDKVTLHQNLPLTSADVATEDAGFDFPRLRPDVIVKLATDAPVNDPDASQAQASGAGSQVTPPPVLQAFQ